MPSELRKIIFERSELYDAVVAYNLRSKNKLPVGELQLIDVGKDPEVFAVFHVINLSTGQAVEKRLGASYIAAALLTYCKNKRIPVSRSFRKSLTLHEGDVALMMTNAIRPAREKAAAPRQAAA